MVHNTQIKPSIWILCFVHTCVDLPTKKIAAESAVQEQLWPMKNSLKSTCLSVQAMPPSGALTCHSNLWASFSFFRIQPYHKTKIISQRPNDNMLLQPVGKCLSVIGTDGAVVIFAAFCSGTLSSEWHKEYSTVCTVSQTTHIAK